MVMGPPPPPPERGLVRRLVGAGREYIYRITFSSWEPIGDDWLDFRQGSGNTIEIFDINVCREKRRDGRGRKLVNELIDHVISKDVRLVWAITRADNFIAQQFYEELKFRSIAPLRYFYQDGAETIDAVMYGRDIGSQA